MYACQSQMIHGMQITWRSDLNKQFELLISACDSFLSCAFTKSPLLHHHCHLPYTSFPPTATNTNTYTLTTIPRILTSSIPPHLPPLHSPPSPLASFHLHCNYHHLLYLHYRYNRVKSRPSTPSSSPNILNTARVSPFNILHHYHVAIQSPPAATNTTTTTLRHDSRSPSHPHSPTRASPQHSVTARSFLLVGAWPAWVFRAPGGGRCNPSAARSHLTPATQGCILEACERIPCAVPCVLWKILFLHSRLMQFCVAKVDVKMLNVYWILYVLKMGNMCAGMFMKRRKEMPPLRTDEKNALIIDEVSVLRLVKWKRREEWVQRYCSGDGWWLSLVKCTWEKENLGKCNHSAVKNKTLKTIKKSLVYINIYRGEKKTLKMFSLISFRVNQD